MTKDNEIIKRVAKAKAETYITYFFEKFFENPSPMNYRNLEKSMLCLQALIKNGNYMSHSPDYEYSM